MTQHDNRSRSWFTGATILLVMAQLFACGGEPAEEETAQPEVAVSTALVETQPFAEILSAIGQVAPRPGHIAALSAPAATTVTGVLVAPGMRVSAGTELVRLDASVFRASGASAAAAVDAAQRNFDRARRLVDAGIAPRRDLEQAQSDLAAAEANLAAARRIQDRAVLRAPFGGVVTRVPAVLGAAVDVGEVLVELADPSAVDILLAMTPAEARQVRVGASVLLRAGADAVPDTLGRGSVADVGGIVDSATRSVSVRVLVSTRRPLRIGETVSGDVTLTSYPAATVVPIEALVPDGEHFKVFVVDSALVAHEREVVVDGRTQGVARIVSGVVAGERVVTAGAYGVEDGAKVSPAKP